MNGSNEIFFLYGVDGEIVGCEVNGEPLYYEKNAQGDVITLLDEYRNVVGSYRYDPWGKILSVTGSYAALNPIRYRGYYYDSETGLYYCQSRYYDPAVGRWLNADSLLDNRTTLSVNLFVYCGNNPVNRADPEGLSWAVFWEFVTTAVSEAGQAMGNLAPAYAGCGAAAAIDGPAPIGDVAGLIAAGAIRAGAIGWGLSQATQALYRGLQSTNTQLGSTTDIYAVQANSATAQSISSAISKHTARDPVHHIVAKADFRATQSRQILIDVGINPVTDPINLVVLPQRYHARLHTNAYHIYVTKRLQQVAGDRGGVEIALASLKLELLFNSKIGLRWE